MKYLCCLLFLFVITGCSEQVRPNTMVSDGTQSLVNESKKSAVPNNQQNSQQNNVILNVPIIKQNPELKYGCEVTSLAMVLQFAGVHVDKMELAKQLQKDSDPIVRDSAGDITHWGNPDHGFVGDVTGKDKGYAVYVGPLETLMNQYLPQRALNLKGKTFEDLKIQIQNGKPVVVWTTWDFNPPDNWDTWQHESETIHITYDLHAVVLVGVDSEFAYINDPLTGEKAHKVMQQSFINAWDALGRQALSYQ